MTVTIWLLQKMIRKTFFRLLTSQRYTFFFGEEIKENFGTNIYIINFFHFENTQKEK